MQFINIPPLFRDIKGVNAMEKQIDFTWAANELPSRELMSSTHRCQIEFK